jgi:hypothetical protein
MLLVILEDVNLIPDELNPKSVLFSIEMFKFLMLHSDNSCTFLVQMAIELHNGYFVNLPSEKHVIVFRMHVFLVNVLGNSVVVNI